MESPTLAEGLWDPAMSPILAEGLRSRNAELHKPSVKSVPPLNSADLPHGIVSIGGRSVELDRVAELTEDLRSHIVAWCRPSIILGTWLNSQTFRSNAAIIPLVSGTTDWLVEPFIPLLVTVIVLRDCFVIETQIIPSLEEASEVWRAVVANRVVL